MAEAAKGRLITIGKNSLRQNAPHSMLQGNGFSLKGVCQLQYVT